MGGVTGGLMRKFEYQRRHSLFYKGNEILGINASDAVSATDAFLSEAQGVWLPDAPRGSLDAFSVEHPSQDAIATFESDPAIGGVTISSSKGGVITGRSEMYFAQNAFSSAKRLFSIMAHEFIHVSQIAALSGQSARLLSDPLMNEIMEFGAYGYQSRIGVDRGMNSFDRGFVSQVQESHLSSYLNSMNFISFPWTNNHNFYYPFK